jgi:CTD small phosphatase-like protein 2
LDITTQSKKVISAGFNIRPYTREMLEEVNKYYEVVVFTASHKWYADVILDYIDPENKYFQHRLYRESCIKTTDNVYIKDLRVIRNVDLKDMILVDNAIYSFGLQLSNGIPIIPFKHDMQDNEFIYLMRYLLDCHHLDDLREPLKISFHFEELFNQYKFDDFIKYYNLEECEMEQEMDEYFEQQLLEKEQNSGKKKGEQTRLQRSVEESLNELDKYFNSYKGKIEKYLNK